MPTSKFLTCRNQEKKTFFWRKLWRNIYAKICAQKIAKNYAKNGFIKPKLDWLLDLLQQRCKHGFGTELMKKFWFV